MNIYFAFSEKENDKIDEWKVNLPKPKHNTKRTFGIELIPLDVIDEDNNRIFKAVFKSSDGHKLLVTKRAKVRN